jgi:hypothetical protein
VLPPRIYGIIGVGVVLALEAFHYALPEHFKIRIAMVRILTIFLNMIHLPSFSSSKEGVSAESRQDFRIAANRA